MLKYLIILLDRTSVAFCHADNPYIKPSLIPFDILQNAITWGMKENMNIQFVYPKYDLPFEYGEIINTVDHIDIRPDGQGDIMVLNDFNYGKWIQKDVVIRLNSTELFENIDSMMDLVNHSNHVTLIIKDIYSFNDDDFLKYKDYLEDLTEKLFQLYVTGKKQQINIITERLCLNEMSNCNAGWESITLAPNGNFYICPSFFYENDKEHVGNLTVGLNIKNAQLYQISYAPVCRKCDAYQCHRCIWLNRKMTLEVNTPSRQQCITAHLERNSSRSLQQNLQKHGLMVFESDIPEIDYLDPFDRLC